MTNAAELAGAEAAYARLAAAPITLETTPDDMQSGVQVTVERIRAASAIARDVAVACAPYESATAPLGLVAMTLHADALDLFAGRVASATIPFPLDLARQSAEASVETQAEIHRQYESRLAHMFAEQAAPVFCLAVRLYQHVLALDPTSARAGAQLAAYGPDFVASCAE